MQEWARVAWPTKCGNCPTTVPAGEPVLVISRLGQWKKYRCAACARVPVTESLEPPPLRVEDRAARVERISAAALLRLVGQGRLPLREPGEEG